MIPPILSSDTPPGERLVFQRLAEDPDCGDWVVLHSLHLAEVRRALEGEIDFVIIIPGVGVLCLEVKSHQSANRDDSGIWRLGAQAPSPKSPFEQAAKGMHSVLDYLKRMRLDLNQVPIWSAVWFTHAVANFRDTPEWHSWQLLDRQDLRQPISRTLTGVMLKARALFEQKFSRFDAGSAEPTAERCQAMTSMLRPKFELSMTPKEVSRERAAERLSFIEEQYEALDLMEQEPRTLFTGPAGTGKSFLAAETARRHAAAGKRVLFLCFNRLLGAMMSDAFADLSLVRTGTLHAYLRDAADLAVPGGADTAWWEEVLPEAALEAILEAGAGFDVLVLDEAQDTVGNEYFLDALDASLVGGLSGGHWTLFGDFEKQMLFGKSDGRTALTTRCPHFSRPKLTHNCRNTPQIGAAASRLAQLPADAYKAYRRRDDGVAPVFRSYRSQEEQEQLLLGALDALKADHYRNGEIVILSSLAEQSLASRLARDDAAARLAPFEARAGRVGYATVQGFKGLQAPAVVVTDVREVDDEGAQSLLYVALSRATDRLYVFAHTDAMDRLAHSLTAGAAHG